MTKPPAVSFLDRLRQRRIVRTVAAYAAAGWVVLQAVDQLSNRGMLPEFVYPLVLVWYVAGLGIALVLGWYHGEKGQQQTTKLELALLALIFLVGVGGSTPTLSEEMRRRTQARAAEHSTLDMQRVAVLYFEDRTADGAAAHIADGLTETLIDELATVRELQVVSRSGVGQFRDRGLRRDSIARALHAGTLVDGSVDQVSGHVSVTVRLLDGESGSEFRRASWERSEAELLDVSDEIVQSAARMLREWLGREVRMRSVRHGTRHVAAWAHYQRADRARKDAEESLDHGDTRGAQALFARSDSLLAHAETLDAGWLQPVLLRGQLALRLARISSGPPLLAHVRAGLAHAQRALTADPNHAAALELRGTLKYWHYLQEIEHDPTVQRALIREARQDLERAIELDPRLAGAHAALSHLYLNQGDEPAAILAGRRALEEDTWLENADVVMFRLATSNYNLERFVESRRWCEEGSRRFPQDHRFAACSLLLLTTPALEPDIDAAWELLSRLDSFAPHGERAWQHIRGALLVGGVIARAGHADSARAVWRQARAQVSHDVDPIQWLHFQEAYLRTFAGDFDEAIDLLKRYAAVNPGASFEHHWWWRELRQHPRYREIAAAH